MLKVAVHSRNTAIQLATLECTVKEQVSWKCSMSEVLSPFAAILHESYSHRCGLCMYVSSDISNSCSRIIQWRNEWLDKWSIYLCCNATSTIPIVFPAFHHSPNCRQKRSTSTPEVCCCLRQVQYLGLPHGQLAWDQWLGWNDRCQGGNHQHRPEGPFREAVEVRIGEIVRMPEHVCCLAQIGDHAWRQNERHSHKLQSDSSAQNLTNPMELRKR